MTTKDKKNIKSLKEHVVNVRCTKQQKELIETFSAREGVGASTWLLQLALRAVRAVQAEDGEHR